jgi:hypothetical protein
MKWSSAFEIIEKSVALDKNFICTAISYFTILAVFINLSTLKSPLIGLVTFVIYFVMNATFLGNVFFAKENAFFRLVFGILLLIMLLGFTGWLVMIIYNLDVLEFTLVLVITTTISSLFNRRMKHKNATS